MRAQKGSCRIAFALGSVFLFLVLRRPGGWVMFLDRMDQTYDWDDFLLDEGREGDEL